MEDMIPSGSLYYFISTLSQRLEYADYPIRGSILDFKGMLSWTLLSGLPRFAEEVSARLPSMWQIDLFRIFLY